MGPRAPRPHPHPHPHHRLPATGYRHDSIPAGVTALRTLGGFDVDATGDHPLQEE
ncbi:hypothetical protein [Streptomyces sp. NPDC050388]|uniref:hypothetical protein n=1 Tax=Streptomyces sp. NPDC050388 TaxID=3155781 RepID=UPI00341804DB